MTAQASKTPRAKRQRQPIYLRCERLVRPETGEEVRAWTALTKWDARALKDRKYHVGDEVRAEFRKPRNIAFHRLAHALGAMLVENVEDFSGLSAHDALKRVQSESGAACETIEYDIPGVGKLTRNEPRSLSFDECDEAEFQEIVKTIYLHIQRRYFPTMTPEAVELMAEAYEVQH